MTLLCLAFVASLQKLEILQQNELTNALDSFVHKVRWLFLNTSHCDCLRWMTDKLILLPYSPRPNC